LCLDQPSSASGARDALRSVKAHGIAAASAWARRCPRLTGPMSSLNTVVRGRL
jgi:hypothetical protein